MELKLILYMIDFYLRLQNWKWISVVHILVEFIDKPKFREANVPTWDSRAVISILNIDRKIFVTDK